MSSNSITIDYQPSGLLFDRMYPNPATNRTIFEFIQDIGGEAEISIVDQNGRIISSFTADTHAGHNAVPIDLSQVSAGLYQVVVSTATGRLQSKLIKQ